MAENRTPEEQLGVPLPEPERHEPAPEAEAAPEEQRPDWLPDNFKQPEDLAKSYREAQQRLTTETQTRSQLENQVAQMQEQLEQLQQQPQRPAAGEWAEQRAQLEEAYENDPLGTMAWLASQAAQQTAQQFQAQQQNQPDPAQERGRAELYAQTVDQQMTVRHQDWGDYKDKVGDLLQEMPHLLPEAAMYSPMEAVKSLDTALEIVRNREYAADGRQGQQQGRQQKLAAQTMTGSAGRSGQSSGPGEKPLSEVIKEAYQGTSWAATRGQ